MAGLGGVSGVKEEVKPVVGATFDFLKAAENATLAGTFIVEYPSVVVQKTEKGLAQIKTAKDEVVFNTSYMGAGAEGINFADETIGPIDFKFSKNNTNVQKLGNDPVSGVAVFDGVEMSRLQGDRFIFKKALGVGRQIRFDGTNWTDVQYGIPINVKPSI
jgi:hypothetical protein